MKWSIRQIEEHSGTPLQISEVVDVKSSLMKRESDIIDVSDVKLNGTLRYDNHSVMAMFDIDVVLTLPSSRTLDPVNVGLTIPVYERYVEEGYLSQYVELLKEDVIIPLDTPYLDLTESVIDNILLNLPIQVLSDQDVSSEDLPSGEGWVLYTEDAYNIQKQKEAEQTVDPRFSGLQNLVIDEDQ